MLLLFQQAGAANLGRHLPKHFIRIILEILFLCIPSGPFLVKIKFAVK